MSIEPFKSPRVRPPALESKKANSGKLPGNTPNEDISRIMNVIGEAACKTKNSVEQAFKVGVPTADGVEFCRVNDARFRWGLKRGIIYRKIGDGTIRSITVREPGKKFGIRLLYVPSIRAWLLGLLEHSAEK